MGSTDAVREDALVMTGPNDRDDRVVIEIGCGPPASRRTSLARSTIGLDIDLQALQASDTEDVRGRQICADAHHLPLRSSSCDVLVLDAVLHHLTPLEAILRELGRILGPAGELRITDGVALDPDEAAALDAELEAAGLPPEPAAGLDLDELTDAIRRVGLRVEHSSIEGRATFATPPHVSRLYSTDRFILLARRMDP